MSEFEEINNKIIKAERLPQAYRNTIESLASAIAAKDSYEQKHVSRVKVICELICHHLNLDENAIEGIIMAALLHDVGKLGVPDYILLKPGPLDSDEFNKIRNHAEIGAKILEHVDYPWDVSGMVRHHHEHYDGSGYPDNLKGEQIPLGARILAVAEVYDALVSSRCYKAGWFHHEALSYIEKLSGKHFDPIVVESFLGCESKIVKSIQISNLEDDISQIEEAGGHVAANIISQANSELMSLFDMAQTLSSTLEIEEVRTLIATRTHKMLNCAACAVFAVDNAYANRMIAKASSGRHQEIIKGMKVKIGKGQIGTIAQSGETYIGYCDKSDFQSLANGKYIDFLHCIIAPIESYGKLIGTINVYNLPDREFNQEDMRKLSLVAGRAALAIQNAGEFEKVRDSATKDQLTSLFNTAHFYSLLEQEFNRASRHKEYFALIGLDLDYLKEINDNFGHQTGDIVIKKFAEIFSNQVRDYDIVARTGGDEFVIILPGASLKQAERTVQRIRKHVEIYTSKMQQIPGKALGVSIGIACFPKDANNIESLIAKADSNMYIDKRSRKQAWIAA